MNSKNNIIKEPEKVTITHKSTNIKFKYIEQTIFIYTY